jgi:hypothetical protein
MWKRGRGRDRERTRKKRHNSRPRGVQTGEEKEGRNRGETYCRRGERERDRGDKYRGVKERQSGEVEGRDRGEK